MGEAVRSPKLHPEALNPISHANNSHICISGSDLFSEFPTVFSESHYHLQLHPSETNSSSLLVSMSANGPFKHQLGDNSVIQVRAEGGSAIVVVEIEAVVAVDISFGGGIVRTDS